MKEEASLTRRGLLGLAAAAGTVMMAGSVSGVVAEKALAEEPTAGSAGISGVRYGFLVEPKYCVGCEKCIKACREKNGLTEDTPDPAGWCEQKTPRVASARYPSAACIAKTLAA